MSTGKYALLLGVIALVACSRMPGNTFPGLYEIIEQHFHDKIVLDRLMPVFEYENWRRGRLNRVRRADGTYDTIYPNAGIDTVLWGQSFLEELVENGLLSPADMAQMMAQLQSGDLMKHLDVGHPLVEASDHILTANRETRKAKGAIRYPYYQLSQPVFNQAGNKVLIQVDEHMGPIGSGWVYLLEKKNGKWEIIYQYQTWIT